MRDSDGVLATTAGAKGVPEAHRRTIRTVGLGLSLLVGLDGRLVDWDRARDGMPGAAAWLLGRARAGRLAATSVAIGPGGLAGGASESGPASMLDVVVGGVRAS